MKALFKAEIAVFMALLIVPSAIWVVFGESSENLENRQLSSFPTFDPPHVATFVRELDDWYIDHVPFKNEAVCAQNSIDYIAFHEFASDQVLAGKSGWLFYSSTGDGNPISDYKGLLIYSEDDKHEYAIEIEDAFAELSSQGAELYIVVAPNKEIAYRAYMPDSIKVISDVTRTKDLEQYLQDNGIQCFTYLDDLVQGDSPDGEALYFQLDTHWNLKGAFEGYKAICSMMAAKSIPNPGFTSIEAEGGDLATMVNIQMYDDENYELASDLMFEEVQQVDDIDSFPSLEIYRSTWNEADKRKILLIGDSYRNNIKGYFAAGFSESAFIHREDFTSETLKSLPFSPDIYLLLSPERYVDQHRSVLRALAEN